MSEECFPTNASEHVLSQDPRFLSLLFSFPIKLARPLGFEPRLTGLEAVVLAVTPRTQDRVTDEDDICNPSG